MAGSNPAGSKILSDLFFNYSLINRSYLLDVSHKYVQTIDISPTKHYIYKKYYIHVIDIHCCSGVLHPCIF